MSAYKKIECNIVDKDTLLEALELLGLKTDVFVEPRHLFGYRGDQRQETAHIVVSREELNNKFTGSSNDIGFLWNGEKYDFIISEYDKKSKVDQRVIQAYVKVALEKALAKQGYKIKVNINNEDLQKRAINELNIVARKLI
jgi:hypothetical protein